MPRTARASVGDICYHVINRGNGRAAVFHKQTDYLSFTVMMRQSCERLPMRVVGWCLMPNHFHLVLWPYENGDLSRWMQWLMTCHVRRYHRHYNSSGHVWQGRFKAFPIQQDGHYLAVLRYVESNPLRANLVQRTEDWPWSSLQEKGGHSTFFKIPQTTLHTLNNHRNNHLLSNGPVQLPDDWLTLVNQRSPAADLETIHNCVKRGSPFGDNHWAEHIAANLGLENTIHPIGRPAKKG